MEVAVMSNILLMMLHIIAADVDVISGAAVISYG